MNTIDLALDSLLRVESSRLRQISTINFIRIGVHTPVAVPVRIDVELNTFAIAALFYYKQYAIQ